MPEKRLPIESWISQNPLIYKGFSDPQSVDRSLKNTQKNDPEPARNLNPETPFKVVICFVPERAMSTNSYYRSLLFSLIIMPSMSAIRHFS